MVQLMNARRALLTAALAFLQLPPQMSAHAVLHAWLDSWTGLGHVIVGMERLGFRASLTRLDDHWRARFSTHPMISDDGYGVAATPWGAVQQAAWQVMKRADQPTGHPNQKESGAWGGAQARRTTPRKMRTNSLH
jgi:hypothetical protein